MSYVIIGFSCIIIGYVAGYAFGLAQHEHELESEIKLRNEYGIMIRHLVQEAKEYKESSKRNEI